MCAMCVCRPVARGLVNPPCLMPDCEAPPPPLSYLAECEAPPPPYPNSPAVLLIDPPPLPDFLPTSLRMHVYMCALCVHVCMCSYV